MILKNKNALITGGSQGIGLAIARAFVKEGAKVAIAGRSLEKLQEARKKIEGDVLIFPADVTKVDDLKHLFSQCHEEMGNLDILIANAGTSQATPLANATEEDVDLLISTNIKGVFFTVQCALPYFNEGGSIILMASLAGKAGVKNFSIYTASKAAVISLAQSFAAELVTKKIRVNSISPGLVRTTIFENPGFSEEMLEKWIKDIPMHRMATPSEVANVALFLVSDQSSYVTATDIAVDGGVSGICSLN